MSEQKYNLKIGILTNTYPPIRNGVSAAVFGLEKNLEKLGVKVFIATPAVAGVIYPTHILPIKSQKLPETLSADLKISNSYIKEVTDFFKKKGVQLIHTHDTVFGGIEGAHIAENLKLPSIHTFHTMIEGYTTVSFPAYQSFIKNYIKQVCNSYDSVIAPSQKVYSYLLDRGITSPLFQIYNSSHLTNQEFSYTDKFKNLVDNDDFVVISFCRLSREKGLHTAIETLKEKLQNNPKLKFVIAGDGPEKNNLEKLCKKLSIENQVIFVGAYSVPELESLVNSTKAKIFLFSSYSENLPTNILEAMYLGLPVLAVDDISVDYLLEDGIQGYKRKENELANLLEKLMQDEDLLNDLSQNARKKAVEFLEKDTANEHIQLYLQLLKQFDEKDKETIIEKISLTTKKFIKNINKEVTESISKINKKIS